MKQRVSQGPRHRRRPGLKFFPRRSLVSRDQFLRHAVGPHPPPLVMVPRQPHFVQVLELPVLRQFIGRQMAVIINNRLARRRSMKQLARDRVRQQKILVAEFHNTFQIVTASNPPSTTNSDPVIKLPASEASNSAAPASSCASPNRAIGVCAMMVAMR